MALTIDDTIMTSDQSAHTARQVPGRRHGWEVSWLPGRIVDRDTAITAMILADIAATGDIHPGHRLWPAVQSWSAEVGLTGLSRDLLYDEMRRGNLASVKAGRRRLITRQHLQQFPGIAS